MVVRPPALLPGLGLAFISAPSRCGVFLPPAHQADELLADLAADRAARQQMFGAVGLRRLRQDHGAAMAHQQIARRAQRRIGGDAGIAVGAAALQRHRQFARRHRLALHFVRVGQRLAHEGDAGFHGLAGAADFLDVHRAQAAGELLLLHQPADLVHLAAEAEHDRRRRNSHAAHSRRACGAAAPAARPASCRSRSCGSAPPRRRHWGNRRADCRR